MVLASNGNVGIGTTAPNYKLTIQKDVAGAEGAVINLVNSQYASSTGSSSAVRFQSAVDFRYAKISAIQRESSVMDRLAFGIVNYSDIYNEILSIKETGNVGIGTTNPQNKLDVVGAIRCTEVKVVALPWADFVFHPTYQLRTLSEVEQFIKANNHLPEIPTAAEVKENGIGLGEMNAKLLQKVEELTLYMIEQQKVNEKQNQLINELERKLEVIANKK